MTTLEYIQCTRVESSEAVAQAFAATIATPATGNDLMEESTAKWQPAAQSLLRVVTALMLFQFGVAKLLKFPPTPSFANVEVLSLFGIAGLIEFFIGGLLLVGLYSRLAAFILSGEMAFAYFISNAPKGFYPIVNGGSLAIMLCFTCLYLTTAGGGPFSLDAVLRKKG